MGLSRLEKRCYLPQGRVVNGFSLFPSLKINTLRGVNEARPGFRPSVEGQWRDA